MKFEIVNIILKKPKICESSADDVKWDFGSNEKDSSNSCSNYKSDASANGIVETKKT